MIAVQREHRTIKRLLGFSSRDGVACKMMRQTFSSPLRSRSAAGFTLVEIMVAIVLGLLLTFGILQLFDGTSRTNKLQNGLARLQENGRYAVARIDADLRMLGAQRCSNYTGNATTSADRTPIWASRSMVSYVTSLPFPDSSTGTLGGGSPYRIDPSLFVQGYECSSGCSIPALGAYANESLAVDQRVPNSDVLTIRYQSGTGWPVKVFDAATAVANDCGTNGDEIVDGTVIPLINQTGDDAAPSSTPAAVVISSCMGSVVLPVSGMSGPGPDQPPASFTVGGSLLAGAPSTMCKGSAVTEIRAFDWSDFVTVSYFLVFRENMDPDAGIRDLVPTLVRRVNGGPAEDVVQGVDQLELRYGVLDSNGTTRYMTADEVDAADVALCTAAPEGLVNSSGCLWRDVRAVEVHLLVNSTDQIHNLDAISRSFVFQGVTTNVAADGSTTLASGQVAGSMLRREFVTQVMVRNRNP